MKVLFQFVAGSLLGILGLSQFVAAEAEPNNSAAQANPVKIGEVFTFQLQPIHDRDYFSLVSPGNGTLRLELAKKLEVHKGLYPWWGEIENATGEATAYRPGQWDRRAAKGESITLAIRSHRHGFNEVTNDETIAARVLFTPEVSDGEPNDSASQAEPQVVGTEFRFAITPRHDHDYFRVVSPGAGTLRFRLTSELTEHRGLYPWWGEAEGENGTVSALRPGMWDRRVAEGESVLFAIRSHQHGFNERSSDEIITGLFEFVPQVGAEPNDSASQATPVTVGEEFPFSITPLHDHDYFRVVSPGAGTLRFRLTSELTEHRGLYPWWGEAEGENGTVSALRPGMWDRRVAEGESVLFAIRSHQHGFNERSSDEIITGLFEFVPQVGAEPNDIAAQATPVTVGEEFTFSITPLHDQDYFTFTSPGEGTVRFELTSQLQEHRGLHPWWGEVTGENGKTSKQRPGTWDRRVADGEKVVFALRSNQHGFNEQSSDEVIRGRFEFIPEGGGSEPNDTPEMATLIEIDKPFELTFLPLHDVDCFRIVSPGRGVVRLERLDAARVHRGAFPRWRRGDSWLNGYWETRAAEDEPLIVALRSSQYSFNEAASEAPISFVARFIPEAAASEPGDTPAEAVEATIGPPIEFAILPQWDRDFIRFTPEKDGFVTFVLDVQPDQPLTWWWQKPGLAKPIEEPVLEVKSGEAVYLGLSARRFSWSSGQVFSGHLEYTDGPPAAEDQIRRWTFKIERQSSE